MAWIEFHGSRIKRLKKFRDLKTELGWSVNETLGFLGSFWGEVIELAEDGDVSGWTPEYVAELTGLTCSPAKVWECMGLYGWLDLVGDRVLVHDWIDTAGLYLTRKYSTSNKPLLCEIWSKYGKVYGDSERIANGKRTNSEPTLPNQTLPNQPKRVAPPSLEEVQVYFKDKGRTHEQGEKFWSYYEANGWMSGRNPIKKWQAAASGWILRDKYNYATKPPPQVKVDRFELEAKKNAENVARWKAEAELEKANGTAVSPGQINELIKTLAGEKGVK